MIAMLFRQQQAGGVDVTAGDMTMDINGAGHHDFASNIINLIKHGIWPRIADDKAIPDKNIVKLSINLLRWIIKYSPNQFAQHSLHLLLKLLLSTKFFNFPSIVSIMEFLLISLHYYRF